MKKIMVLIMVVMLYAISVQADNGAIGPPEDLDRLQNSAEKRFRVEKNRNAIHLKGGLSRPYNGTPEQAAYEFIKDYHKIWKLSPELKELKKAEIEITNVAHGKDIKYQQYHNGIRVINHHVVIMLDDKNRVYKVLGMIEPLEGFSTDPAIQPFELESLLMSKVPAYGPIIREPELCILAGYETDYKPTLIYFLFAREAGTDEPYMLYVDANNGEILMVAKGRFNLNKSGGDDEVVRAGIKRTNGMRVVEARTVEAIPEGAVVVNVSGTNNRIKTNSMLGGTVVQNTEEESIKEPPSLECTVELVKPLPEKPDKTDPEVTIEVRQFHDYE